MSLVVAWGVFHLVLLTSAPGSAFEEPRLKGIELEDVRLARVERDSSLEKPKPGPGSRLAPV
jgi:hypothetical protein